MLYGRVRQAGLEDLTGVVVTIEWDVEHGFDGETAVQEGYIFIGNERLNGKFLLKVWGCFGDCVGRGLGLLDDDEGRFVAVACAASADTPLAKWLSFITFDLSDSTVCQQNYNCIIGL